MVDLILPLYNNKVTLFRGISVLLVGDMRIVNDLDDEDSSLVFRYIQEKRGGYLQRISKWIYISNVTSSYRDKIVLVEFLFNAFRRNEPIQIPWYFVKEEKKLNHYNYANHMSSDNRITYGIDTDKKTFEEFYKILCAAYNVKKCLILPLERFSWALTRSNLNDRIVDLSIALEALLPDRVELTHKISMYFSIVNESDPSKRKDTFNRIKKFYKARSCIVHGAQDARDVSLYDETEEWTRISDIVKQALLYYIFFCASQGTVDWKDHLLNLALGVDKRITE